ncbi:MULTISPECIES: SMP-30/gluconolactonase/LRE family protein [unclassified Arcicella]|uniref:SMP-30/gluconolactonase/LRE family protein n=1 Tax=unclassified Arcicella TaxID=2644986 RepID=UPI0028578912|nr:MULTISPECIES: SMP-30/gluconolactonase/LRE family protein [unclassified Arcicella]MDR6564251.1 gluconolactonase [Arcicella sp. BE51]MDR6811502.1 gluconolactonase [Arcicella sp. BE140]MDR6823028.1 gluconolactonase [Arcicella sp. BE139]
MIKFSHILAVLLLSNQLLLAQSNEDISSLNLIQKGAVLVQVSKQFTFTEGPAVDKKGNIYFTDQPNDKIWKYSTDGKLTLFMEKSGRSNGLYFDKKGNIISCADEHNELWAINLKGEKTVLLDNIKGHKANGPNDLWIDAKGGIYFTDPYYQRDYWTRQKPDIDKQNVYYLAKGATQPIEVDADLKRPNGIVGTPDGKYLYVADIGDSKTYRYEIQADGTLANRQLFAPMGSDGMTLDNQGNLYITGKGVTIYNPQGIKLGNIPVPSNWVGNICFGGKDRKTLFITASESVYTLQMQVKGVE